MTLSFISCFFSTLISHNPTALKPFLIKYLNTMMDTLRFWGCLDIPILRIQNVVIKFDFRIFTACYFQRKTYPLKREIFILLQKATNALQPNTTSKEAIVARAVAATVPMDLTLRRHSKQVKSKQWH